MKKLKEFLLKKEYLFFIFITFYFLIIDFFNRYLIIRSFDIKLYMSLESIIFDIFWITILNIILYISKGIIKRIIAIFISLFLLLFSIANYFINSYFGSVLSWRDLFLTGDGFSFISSIFKFINLKLIIFIIFAIVAIVLLFKLSKYEQKYKIKSLKSVFILILLISLLLIYSNNNKKLTNTVDGWNSSEVMSNKSNYYSNWINPNELILIGGTYDYIFRDFYVSFIKKENIKDSYQIVEKYIDEKDKVNDKNEYQGIFENKNLIFVMLESMDDWMVSKEVTPTIWKMMHSGFNFTEHYSPVYVTGATANTEFIANTGIYPNINKLSPNYAYTDNNFVYSLPNLFKNNGYTVNSFHRSFNHVYNRAVMHESMGYEKYHNYVDMEISDKNLDLDSHIIKNAYNKIVTKDKFMSFIITYSPHTPYNYSKIECQKNLKDIEKLKLDLDEEKICALSSARETDNMFKLLLEKLEKDKLLEDTVIIAFSDHPNNVVMSETETEKLNKTIFFIYNSEMKNKQIETFSSSINILPTINNLFNLKSEYVYPGCDLLNCDENYIIFNDFTYYNGEKILPVGKRQIADIDYSKNLLISDYYK